MAMKKVVIGVLSAAVLLLVLLGRDLLDLVRLMDYIEKSTAASLANGGPWPQLSETCLGCHGFDGSSQDQRYPSLAGQPAAYTAAQLRSFASGQRASQTMGPLAMTLSAEEIEQLSAYYAKQPIQENRSFEPAPALREKGQQLVASRGCAACHGEGLMGRDLNPRLAGQGYDYLVAQLDAFAAGTRSEATGTMKQLAAGASPEERQAMATYLASLASHKE